MARLFDRFRSRPRQGPPIEWLIVGLGNPGPGYADTRHNVGFRVVEGLAARHRLSFGEMRAEGLLARGSIPTGRHGVGVVLLKPLSYVNRSGPVVRAARDDLGLAPHQLLIVYDDLDLPRGQIRLRERGSSGGHRGLQSIIDSLHTEEIPRLRVGIGRPQGEDPVDYVLSPFSQEERAALDALLPRGMEAIEVILRDGMRAAMNRFNA
ncbi:MAG: aminoacyl-tRNA hydrolase [Chloroflexi bacterium]|nr:aminoacyl-tRNA hydrolase [Chloroflexota bacterium]